MLTTILIILIILYFARNIYNEFINNPSSPLDVSTEKESTIVEGNSPLYHSQNTTVKIHPKFSLL